MLKDNQYIKMITNKEKVVTMLVMKVMMMKVMTMMKVMMKNSGSEVMKM